jgi:phosphodiesterase/alkaline phosphatase D-like protein
MTSVADLRRVDDRWAHRLTTFGLTAGPAAAAILAFLSWAIGVPKSGYAGFWETAAQVALLVVYAIASLAARRFRMTGATIMVVTAFAIGALSAVKYEPLRGLLIALALFAPAGALWLVWQRSRNLPAVGALAGVLVIVLAVSGNAADYIFNYFYGPQTPQSSVEELPDSTVEWAWSGGVTATTATVVARTRADDAPARLAYSTDERFIDAPVVEPAVGDFPGAGSEEGVHRFRLTKLKPATTYYYAVVVDGERDTTRTGRFRTATDGPMSMSIAFAACARLGSNAAVFDTIAGHQPDLYLATGDWFYGDIATNDPDVYLRDYTTTLTSPAQSSLFRSAPIAYVWDDHDYGPNDGDRTSPSREAALSAYRDLVPHQPFGLDGDEAPIAQAFTLGRVRVIMTDLRSQRSPATDPDGPDKTMMGDEQKAWFLQELAVAKDRYPLILWVSSVPWIDRSTSPGDNWGAYATERAELADAIAELDVTGLVMLAGDAHMVAADDGTNSNFSDSPGKAFPVLHAAALDRPGSEKGGPYSQGLHAGGGQYGWLDIDDDGGDTIAVSFEGRTFEDEVLVRWSGTFPAEPAAER